MTEMSYTQVSAGRYHTALLRNDGHVVACGDNYFGQRDIPALDEGMAYIQVSSGGCHTVFLRSDGMCVCVWPADVISLTSATFHLQRRGVTGWVSQLQAVDICAMPI